MKTVVFVIMCVALVSGGVTVGFLLALSNPQPNNSSGLPEYLLVSEPEYYVGTDGWFAMAINNTGVGSVTIVKVLVNNVKQSSANPALPFTVAPDHGFVLNVTMTISKGIPYQIDLFTSQGNKFSKLSEVPSHGGQAGVMLYKANTNFYSQNGTLKIDVDVGNSGTQGTTLTTLFIGTSVANMQNMPITPVPLPAGKVARITVAYIWIEGGTYFFKVQSSTGQTFDWPEQAPFV